MFNFWTFPKELKLFKIPQSSQNILFQLLWGILEK